METLQIAFSDGSPGQLACEAAGTVTCQRYDEGRFVTAEEAGTLYLLLHEGQEEPGQVEAARGAGYTVEVQHGAMLDLPPQPRKRRSP